MRILGTASTTDPQLQALTKKYHRMFLIISVYNIVTAVSLLQPESAYESVGIYPIPAQDNSWHLCCLLIGWSGFNYYLASQDFPAYASLVWFGMTGKSLNLVVAVIDVLLGTVTWQLLLVLSPDIVCIALFYSALKDLDNHHKQQQKRMKTNK